MVGPSLGHYFHIHTDTPSDKPTLHTIQSTKQLLKEHMVDSFFERALREINAADALAAAPTPSLDGVAVEDRPAVNGNHNVLSPPLPSPRSSSPRIQLLTEPVETKRLNRNGPGGKTLHETTPRESTRRESTRRESTQPPSKETIRALLTGNALRSEQEPADDETFEPVSPIDLPTRLHTPILDASEPDLPLYDHELHDDDEFFVDEDDVRFGYYVFAITLDQSAFSLPADNISADYPLYIHPHGNIRAILAEVPLDVYGENALQARLNDPSWFEAALKKHNRILSRIQSEVSIVPMRVCTICDSPESLDAFLDEHHDDFTNTLELIEGNQAWRLTISCNERKVRLLTEKASNRVRAIQAELIGKSSEDAQTLLMQLETVLAEEARSVCKACIKHSHGTLSLLASKTLTLDSAEHPPMPPADQDIFRCEYLISNLKSESFLDELKALQESYKSLGFDIQVEGPFPPEHFAERRVLPGENGARRESEAKRGSGRPAPSSSARHTPYFRQEASLN